MNDIVNKNLKRLAPDEAYTACYLSIRDVEPWCLVSYQLAWTPCRPWANVTPTSQIILVRIWSCIILLYYHCSFDYSAFIFYLNFRKATTISKTWSTCALSWTNQLNVYVTPNPKKKNGSQFWNFMQAQRENGS